MSQKILELKNISKTFLGVKALDNVSFSLNKGSIHGLIGENGAGKSTLMKVLYGIYKPDGGEIYLYGQKIEIRDPAHAIKSGIALIPQEIDPVRNLTVKGNIFLGREIRDSLGLLDEDIMYQETKELLKVFHLNIDPNQPMEDISLGQSQLISIITAASWNCKIIVMDEPTSALTEKEIKDLYTMVRKLQSYGYSIIYISHKLQELYDLCDTITVLRDGHTIDSQPIERLKKEDLIQMMVGREINEYYAREEHEIYEEIFSIRNLIAEGVNEVSFNLHRGEILGFYGLIGAGRSEIMESLFGYRARKSGEFILQGKIININSPLDAIKYKFAFVTEDRKVTGLFLSLTINNNIIMPSIKEFETGSLIDDKKSLFTSQEQIKAFNIKAYSPIQNVGELSGGNQQKVLIARWLLTNPDIIILDEPTRGIDVGAKGEIHHIISKLAAEGKSVIVVSSEIPEILSLSDRIIIMHEGSKIGELSQKDASSEKIMDMILQYQVKNVG
ncbi:MAG: sugar ABC transporter ATP-binding protein [Brevinema sp.]